MATVFLGLGSNIEPRRYIQSALKKLRVVFGELRVSPVYKSAAVGFDGAPFLNLVVEIKTDVAVHVLSARLRKIEDELGRDRAQPKFSARTIDIDILLYGDEVGVIDGVTLPRSEILKNAFVLCPLADLAPERLHPIAKQSYQSLWENYDRERQPVKQVEALA